MSSLAEFPLIWAIGGVLGLGLVSAWFARIGAGSAQQTLSQGLFLGCLPMVAGATILSFGLGPGYWLASVATFAVMVLTATADTRRSSERLSEDGDWLPYVVDRAECLHRM